MASRKTKKPIRKKKSAAKKKKKAEWRPGQVLRIVIPQENELFDTGIPAISLETAMPEFLQHLEMLEYEGPRDISGNTNHIFKRLNDWNQEFILSPGFFSLLEKRKAAKRRMRAPF